MMCGMDRQEPRPLALALGGLIALAAAMGIGRFVYTPILPRMAEDLGMTKSTAGFLASANFAGYLAGALVAATPLLRGARRRWLLAGLAGSAATTGAMAFVSSTTVFAALRFAGGVASAFVLVFASALVLDRLSLAGRFDLAAVHFAGVGTGIAVSAALVTAVVAWGGGWRVLWLASGLVSLLALAGAARLIPDRTEAATTAPPPAARRARRLVLFTAAYGLFGFGYVITATFLVAIVRGSHAVRALEPVVWIVVGLAAVPSVAFWTAIAERLGIARAFALACVAQAAGVAASVLWVATAGVFCAAVLLGGTIMGLTALGLIGGRRLAAGDPRSTLAAMTAVFGVGQIVGPLFAGMAYDATGSFLVPSMAAAAALLLGAVLAIAGWSGAPAGGQARLRPVLDGSAPRRVPSGSGKRAC
jgi:predicted MFS family arabinose efflux permease